VKIVPGRYYLKVSQIYIWWKFHNFYIRLCKFTYFKGACY
jgi:hypothetical protein